MLIGVVAHVQREHLVDKLIRDVQVDVIKWDDRFPPDVAGCADNHIRVLTELSKHANGRWVVVLEDDAEPIPNFREQAESALATAGSPLVGFYLGSGNPNGPTQRAIIPAVKAAEASDSHWIVADWFISTVGYAVRSTWLPALLAALTGNGGPVDNRINEWSHSWGLKTWYAQPSLVDHSDVRTLIGGGGIPDFEQIMPRRAHRVGWRPRWDASTTDMGYAKGWSPRHVRQAR
jgi:hypothetical protein